MAKWIGNHTYRDQSGKFHQTLVASSAERETAVWVVQKAAESHAAETGHAIDKVWDFPGKHSIHCECHEAFVATLEH